MNQVYLAIVVVVSTNNLSGVHFRFLSYYFTELRVRNQKTYFTKSRRQSHLQNPDMKIVAGTTGVPEEPSGLK